MEVTLDQMRQLLFDRASGVKEKSEEMVIRPICLIFAALRAKKQYHLAVETVSRPVDSLGVVVLCSWIQTLPHIVYRLRKWE